MNYLPPSRKRRVAKWVGLCVCVFILIAWAASSIIHFGVTHPIIPRIQSGTADSYSNGKKIATGPPMYWARYDSLFHGQITINGLASTVNDGWMVGGIGGLGLSLDNFGFVPPRAWRGSTIPGAPASLVVMIPMWLPFIVIAVLTALLWHRDRRPPTGHCDLCGYDLTGNESGVCPECAAPCPVSCSPKYAYRVGRFSRRAALVISVVIYVAVLVLTPIAIESISQIVWRREFILNFGGSETLGIIVAMFVSLIIPYLVARPCFGKLRWRVVRSAVPLCPKCLCSLSGNESGVCPECATPAGVNEVIP